MEENMGEHQRGCLDVAEVPQQVRLAGCRVLSASTVCHFS